MFDGETHLSLFPEADKPLPELPETKHRVQELVFDAVDFAARKINERRINLEQLVAALTEQFGFEVRLILFDVFDRLRSWQNNQDVRDFCEQELTLQNVAQVFGGKHLPPKLSESTLDELFQKSIEFGSKQKLIEVMAFVSKLKEYSVFNNTLVYLQRPTAKYWATTTHWKKAFNRTVKPNALPIVILRPRGPVMVVYDVEDTVGRDLPPGILNSLLVAGNLDPAIYKKTFDNCKRLGIVVEELELSRDNAGRAIMQGDSKERKLTIEINHALDERSKYSTLCHEIAHILLGHLGGDPYGRDWVSRIGLTRTQTELEAEAVAYLVCVRANLTARSAEYLAGYISDANDLAGISVEQIMKVASFVERMGRETVQPKKDKGVSVT